MQILSSILRVLRYRNVAMIPLSYAARFPFSFMASATNRWWLARRFSPITVSPPVSRVFRRVKDNESDKPYRQLPISSSSVVSLPLDNIDTRGAILGEYVKSDTWRQIVKHTGSEEDESSTNEDHKGKIVVSDEEVSDDEEYTFNGILVKSRHRDGSMYRSMDIWWKQAYRIEDRNETRLEAMVLSNPTNCIIYDGLCYVHGPWRMLQFLSIEVDKLPVDGDSVELYGYIAVRDDVDGLLNYIVNFSRDKPIIVEQGSLIKMAGPKRGIDMMDMALIEFDMKIKIGEQEKDDLQLIDGASLMCFEGIRNCPFTLHIPGDCGAVNLNLARLDFAIEATIEVLISEVQSSFNLSLVCLTSGLDMEIRLFDGAIPESCGLKRSVVAVRRGSLIDLKFKLASLLSSSVQHCCSFEAKSTHGHDTQEIKTDFALISVKVTWSTVSTLGLLAA